MIRAIVAIDEKRGMANDDGIPWDLPTDKRYFHETVENSDILMGYGTYVEFEKPMSSRRNIVASAKDTKLKEGFELVTDARKLLQEAKNDIWVIGGAGLLATTIDLIDELYITQVQGDFHCTKFFPEYEHNYRRVSASEPMRENGITFWYEIWRRK